jgi:hypothetical protein
MKIVCWYKNGSIETLSIFCNQNQDKPISVKLTNRQECVEGKLHSYDLDKGVLGISGIFLLLTDRVIHPAYYGLDGIESLHIGLNEARSPFTDGAFIRDVTSMNAATSGC